MSRVFSIALRLLGLTIIMFVCFAVAAGVVGLKGPEQTPAQAATSAATLLLVCLLISGVFTHLILRSRWHGWRLAVVVFVVLYGTMTVMGQIESAFFITRLPEGVLPRLFWMGALVAAPFSVLAVLILGKRKPAAADTQPNSRLALPAGEWAWKLAIIVVAYVALYFTFGYFVAWKVPEVREYYGGVDPGSFLAQLASVVRERPMLIPLQILRALLWVALALPVLRMLKGRWQETALALGLIFAVTNAQLLLPNPYMPDAVRMAHLVETAPSNFLFGLLIGWLLGNRHALAYNPVALRS